MFASFDVSFFTADESVGCSPFFIEYEDKDDFEVKYRWDITDHDLKRVIDSCLLNDKVKAKSCIQYNKRLAS